MSTLWLKPRHLQLLCILLTSIRTASFSQLSINVNCAKVWCVCVRFKLPSKLLCQKSFNGKLYYNWINTHRLFLSDAFVGPAAAASVDPFPFNGSQKSKLNFIWKFPHLYSAQKIHSWLDHLSFQADPTVSEIASLQLAP